jgi:antitoxin YefM
MARNVKPDPRMVETFHLLKTPANVKHLEKSLKQYRQGQTKTKAPVDAK